MKISLANGRFGSFDAPFEWESEGNFAVITGPNGSGKSQLLRLIEVGLEQRISGRHFAAPVVSLSEIDCSRAQCLSITSVWSVPGGEPTTFDAASSMHAGTAARTKLFMRGDSSGADLPPQLREEATRIVSEDRSAASLSDHELATRFSVSAFRSDDPQLHHVAHEITMLSMKYLFDWIKLKIQGLGEEGIASRLGTPPWEWFNRFLRKTSLPYQIVPPTAENISCPYRVLLRDPASVGPITFEDLSFGERALMALAAIQYNIETKRAAPRLMILDEPDASLHPAVIPAFVSTLADEFAGKHGVQVVMTTHRPDTLVMVPAESIWEMRRQSPRIAKCSDRPALLRRLCADTVYVHKPIKCVLVEDDDDASFHGDVMETLQREGLWRMRVVPAFVPASSGRGGDKVGGGSTVVEHWTGKLVKTGLEQHIRGLVDRDDGRPRGSGLVTFARYSIENYIFDPIVLFCVLVGRGAQETSELAASLGVGRGDEARIRGATAPDLQAIVSLLERNAPSHVADQVQVMYQGNRVVNYPAWFIVTRGKDVARHWHECLKIDLRHARESHGRLRLVSLDLLEAYEKLCG